MKYSELGINEVESTVGFAHGRDVARRGGSKAAQAQADADRAAAKRVASATPPGTTQPPADTDSDTGAPAQSPSSTGTGQVIPNSNTNPLFTLTGEQSPRVRAAAEETMQNDTLPRARRMAGIFGAPLVINDAIAKRGTSRETATQASQHFFGRALDISVARLSNEQKIQLVGAALQAGFRGFGFGNTILHVDTGTKRHWSYGNSSYGGMQISQLGNMVRTYTPNTATV